MIQVHLYGYGTDTPTSLADIEGEAQGGRVALTEYVTAASWRYTMAEPYEDAGVTLLEGVCFYILQNLSPMRVANRWTNMVSNSAKIVNIIGAHRFNTILRRTRDCVDIACTGVLR